MLHKGGLCGQGLGINEGPARSLVTPMSLGGGMLPIWSIMFPPKERVVRCCTEIGMRRGVRCPSKRLGKERFNLAFDCQTRCPG